MLVIAIVILHQSGKCIVLVGILEFRERFYISSQAFAVVCTGCIVSIKCSWHRVRKMLPCSSWMDGMRLTYLLQ
jgi:hypothetical protein